jgi:hypothetical protein
VQDRTAAEGEGREEFRGMLLGIDKELSVADKEP